MTERRVPLTMLSIWLAATLAWWGLAFAPTPAATPEWLASARQVCFGTLDNGLPDTSGWMLLILGPLSFLLGFSVVWKSEIGSTLRHLAGTGSGRAALLVVGVLIGWEASWVHAKVQAGRRISNLAFDNYSDDSLPDNYPALQTPAPPFDLVDQNGDRISLQSLAGKTVLMTFAFAHCKTICPAIIRQNTMVLEELKGLPVELLIVTLDPWRDTPSSLRAMAAKWSLPANAHVLSGPVAEVERVLALYNVPSKRDEKTGDVTHPPLTYVIHPNGTLYYAFSNAPGKWITQAVQRIQHNLAGN